MYTDVDSLQQRDLDPRVVEMYQSVGKILSKYRSGKVPKAFKVIAQFRNWEDLLMLTEPDMWSAAAVYQATRIFTANLKEKLAQRFFNQILLPRFVYIFCVHFCLHICLHFLFTFQGP